MYYHPNLVSDMSSDERVPRTVRQKQSPLRRDFPLQQQARLAGLSSQRAFVQRAKSILDEPVDCLLESSAAGLIILARNEEALALPVMALRKNFGADVKFSAPQVRLIGVPPREPVMQVRINAPVSRIEVVKQHLGRRAISIEAESAGGTRCVLEGEAPLTRLLGLGADLRSLTLGSSLLWTTLVRYEQVAPGLEPSAASVASSASARAA